MSDIEQVVKDAIEEFGDRAYERFYYFHFDTDSANELNDNNALLPISEGYGDRYKLKSLLELFEHDASFYGTDAYLMWDVDTQWILNFNFSFNCNFTVECALINNRPSVRRKTSAALPFDIERAISGGVVEWFDGNNWGASDETICFWRKIYNGNGENLRMKYPKEEK